jgi:uncharacterized protein (UPF0332 family)
MAFDPLEFINVAKELGKGASEAHFRSTINRAYYGAFGYIRNDLGVFIDSPSVHQDVIKTLYNSVSNNKQLAGKKLEALFKQRKHADYVHSKQFPTAVTYMINDAEEVIRLYNLADEEE